MIPNPQAVANELIKAMVALDDPHTSVDGVDREAHESAPGEYEFTMNKFHDRVIPGSRSRIPLGQVIYTVRVTAHYMVLVEDE